MANIESNPSVSLLRSLDKLFNSTDKINAVLYYMPLHSARVNLLRLLKGNYRNILISPNETDSYPDRSKPEKERVKLVPVNKVHSTIYNNLSAKADLFPSLKKSDDLVAVFRFLSASDNNWDILYLLFDDDLKKKIISNYAPLIKTLGSKPSVELLIEMHLKIVYPFFNEIVNSAKLKLEQLAKHSSYNRRLLTFNEQLKSEIKHLKQKKEGEILREFEYLIIDAENNYKKKFTISDAAKDFILNYKGNIDNLKKSFEKAIEDVVYLNTDQNIIIKPIHIELTDYNIENQSGIKSKKREKAADFLQRYEDAAQSVYDKKQPVTINSIAKNMSPDPVSPPAISHNLKKYRSEIIGLLNSNSTNWVILRNYFKPIKNLAENFTN